MTTQVIQYVGVAHTRLISREDFQSVGITDQDEVEFHRDSPITKGQAKVSLAAAEYLVANDTFKAVEPGDVASALRSPSVASGTDETTQAEEVKTSAKSKRG